MQAEEEQTEEHAECHSGRGFFDQAECIYCFHRSLSCRWEHTKALTKVCQYLSSEWLFIVRAQPIAYGSEQGLEIFR